MRKEFFSKTNGLNELSEKEPYFITQQKHRSRTVLILQSVPGVYSVYETREMKAQRVIRWDTTEEREM